MCGIVGIVAEGPGGLEDALGRATAAMMHRGPDDGGSHIFRLGAAHCGFGFRRLAIIDLTAAGHQPMMHPETGDALIFNGEIYNFATLRRELEALGVVFRGHSDSEVLLHSLVAWGEDALPRLQGMYALAFHDRRANRILLARDPLGIKPLYVARHGGRTIFASEVRTILATGLVPHDLDTAGIASLLAYGATQDPLTVHRHIRSLRAGTYEWVRPGDGGHASVGTFWTFPPLERAEPNAQAAEPPRVRALLEDAVRDHLVCDVPIGVFLSAGIDSTVLAALAARQAGSIRTFTVGFDEPGMADELEGAAIVAKAIDAQHEEIVITHERLAHLWQAWLSSADRPSADGLNTFVICRAVREAGLTVALSGLGSDELFGGYGSFTNAVWQFQVTRRLRLLPGPVRRLAVTAAARLLAGTAREKAVDMFCEPTTLAESVLQVRRMFSGRQLRLLGVEAAAVGLPAHYLVADVLAEATGQDPADDPFAVVSRLETRLYMGNTLLRDTDVNSMASSLEVRVPYLAQPLVNHVAALPGAVRSPPGSAAKHLLRTACRDLIPPAIFQRPKTGFSLPVERWMRGPMRDACAASIDAAAGCGLLDPAGVQRIWREFLAPGSQMRGSRPLTLVALGSYLKAGYC